MPREMKGSSPQLPKSPERVHLEKALEDLVRLFTEWNLDSKDYVLVDEFAYLLQGYGVVATEIESGHIDVYVDPKKLLWDDRKERSIIPPIDSGGMDGWVTFMKKTGYSLDMLRATSEIIQIPTVEINLPNGSFIRVMRVFEMTEAFVEQTIMHYSIEDVGEKKIREWIDKLELIGEVAEEKNDQRLMALCKEKLVESREKWSDILSD